jgi:hypothetical protein
MGKGGQRAKPSTLTRWWRHCSECRTLPGSGWCRRRLRAGCRTARACRGQGRHDCPEFGLLVGGGERVSRLPTTSVRAPITVQTYAKLTLMPLSRRSPRKPPVALEETSLYSARLSQFNETPPVLAAKRR